MKKLERIKGFSDEEEIAHHLEISEDEYYDIKNGKWNKEPSLYVIANLANYFNVSLDYLVGRSDDPSRH